jgi:hypothetical protein
LTGFDPRVPEQFMSRIVRRQVGFVSFESLPAGGSRDDADERHADSPGGALGRLRRIAGTQAGAAESKPVKIAALAVAGDQQLDANLKQLQDDLYAEVAQLVGQVYGTSGNRPPR